MAQHYYRFNVCEEDGIQDYLMECALCGKGASSHRTEAGKDVEDGDVVTYHISHSAAGQNGTKVEASSNSRRSANHVLMENVGNSVAFAAAAAVNGCDDDDGDVDDAEWD